MDPLSISASVLTLVAAVGACLKRIKILQGAPQEIQSLASEIEDLRIVIQEVANIIQNQQTFSENSRASVTTQNISILLSRASHNLMQLDDILNQKLLVGNLNETRYSRTAWLKYKSKVEEIKTNLAGLKINLMTVIGASTSTQVSRIHTKLEEIMNAAQGASNREVVHGTRLVVKDITNNSTTTTNVPIPTNEELFDLLQGKGSNSTCPKWCSCICHKPKNISTPRLLRAVVGGLSVGYANIPFRTPACNQKMCRPQQKYSTRITYQFPNWLLMRAISVLVTSSEAGPELLLRTLRILPSNAAIFRMATSGDLVGMKEQLSSGKASIHDVDDRRWSLLHKSYLVGQEEVVKFLLDQGADINLEADNRSSVVERAWYSDRTSTGNLSLNHDYIFRQIDIQQLVETQQYTTLHKIVLCLSNIDLESILSNSTSEIEIPDTRGRSPLWWAAARGDESGVRTLIKHGALVNTTSDNDFTPLHIAKTATVTRLLLEAGARVDAVDNVGRTALHVCAYRGDYRSGTKDILSTLLEYGSEGTINKRNNAGQTALHYTAAYGYEEHADVLLNHGADIEARGKHDRTPLMEAVSCSSPGAIRLLLQRGANQSAITQDGKTILHCCAADGSIATMEALSKAGLILPDVNAKDIRGFTPREYVTQRQDVTEELWAAFEELISSIENGDGTGDGGDEAFEDTVESWEVEK